MYKDAVASNGVMWEI